MFSGFLRCQYFFGCSYLLTKMNFNAFCSYLFEKNWPKLYHIFQFCIIFKYKLVLYYDNVSKFPYLFNLMAKNLNQTYGKILFQEWRFTVIHILLIIFWKCVYLLNFNRGIQLSEEENCTQILLIIWIYTKTVCYNQSSLRKCFRSFS